MQTEASSFPTPEPNDASGVVIALEAGNADWGRGDFREAVRWVHRAADAAEAAGDDRRAVGLARAAADLMTKLELSLDSSPRDEGSALASFDDFNDQTIVDSPLTGSRAMQQSSVSLIESATPAVLPAKAKVPPRPSPKSRPAAAANALRRPRTALRVAVTQDQKRSGTLVAELLDDGAELPAGACEALLVLLDPEAALVLERS